MEVEVPPESQLERMEILTEELKRERLAGLYTPVEEVEKAPEVAGERIFTHGPLSTKLYLELSPPTLEDNIGDIERLFREIRKDRNIPIMQMGLANIKRLPKILRESDWKVTVTLGDRNETCEVFLIEPGNTEEKNFGISLDIGTTTIVAYLIDLNHQRVLGAKASHNPQISFGEDVITRIIFAQEEGGLEKLHHAVVDVVNNLVYGLVQEHGLTLNDITGVVAAGNTTMIQLLLQVDPTFIRKEPYIPTANQFPVIRAIEAGIKIHPRGLLSCIPGVAGYVGGDITSGVLASGMDNFSLVSLFIDLGTNGEVVLGNKDWLVCCSTSAGPCFEGGGVKWGIRAMSGAIQKVEIKDGRVKASTIQGAKPRGICGSGLISLIGEMFKKCIIDKKGEIQNGPGVIEGEDGKEFVIVKAGESAGGENIVITEADVKSIIHSKGAIYSGAEILLKSVGLNFDRLAQIIISGGLGTSLEIEKAIMIGLLPDLPLEKFSFIGNSAITGAKMCLLSREAMQRAEEIARKMTYVDLSTNPEFMNNYTASLFLPHTDISLFPTVKKQIQR